MNARERFLESFRSSPPQASRRTFLALLAASGVAGAQDPDAVAAFRKSVTGFVDDNNPVDLLPRLTPPPEVVPGIAKPRLDLNGTWRFHPAPPPEFWKGGSDSGWSGITVPGQWVMQGFSVKSRQAGGYRLRFQAPADWAGQRVKLRFDAVYSKAEVWMNGKPVGSHLGAFTPFEFDVTSAILPGTENVLALAVYSESLADALTVGLEMVGHPMGGIIRKVSMFVVPPLNVSSLHVETTFDREYRNAILHIAIDVANEAGPKKGFTDAELVFSLHEFGRAGTPVKLSPAGIKLAQLGAGQILAQQIEIRIDAPKKWDAEHPNLYVLGCELRAGGNRYSTQQRFGFRQVEIKDGLFLLNGQPIRLRGMSRQDTHPLTGRTVAPEVHKQDIDWMLWANCNNTYTCAFLPDEESLNLCDEKGLYVMDEPGTCWVVGGRSGLSFDDPRLFPYYLQPVLEMIERDRSHPSVITWMIADESHYGRNFREVLKMARTVDPSRPVHMAWDPEGGHTRTVVDPRAKSPFGLGSWHYPGPDQLAIAAASRRPVVFDQSVSAYFVNVPELMADPGLRDDWGRQYEVFWEKCWATRSILGGQAFNLNDDQYLVPSGITGNGDWGFVDPWRRAKPEMWHIRKIHTPVKIQDAPLPLPAEGGQLEIPVENRYDFTDLRDVRIEWSLGDESGIAQAQLPPHGKGTLAIRPQRTDLKGRTLELKISRDGQLVDAYRLPIGPASETPVRASSKPKRRVDLVQTKETITARGDGFAWVVSRETGQLVEATRNGQAVLVGGPVLMILTAKDYEMPQGILRPRPASFSPLNETCSGWKAASVTAARSGEAVEITVTGQYKEAAGKYSLGINSDGDAEIGYQFRYAGIEKAAPRQIGMVFYTPRSLDTLTWKRKAQWSVYPEDHIGRPEGAAKALPDPSLVAKEGAWMEVAYREKPSWPWFADANALGTRDFRATRRNILRASLKDAAGHGVTVISGGTHHTRAFLDGSRVGLLVASYSGPGGVTIWLHGINQVAGFEPAPIEKGTEFKDNVRLVLGTG